MTARVSSKEMEVLAPSPVISLSKKNMSNCNLQSVHASTLHQLHTEKENVLASIANTKAIILAKKESIANIHSKARLLHEKGEEFSKQNQNEDTKTAYALDLYSKVSNITWDYSCPPGHLAGCSLKSFQVFIFINIFQISDMITPKITRNLILSLMCFRPLTWRMLYGIKSLLGYTKMSLKLFYCLSRRSSKIPVDRYPV